MAYVKQTWENLPSTNTPITAERLNHMEDGIDEAWQHGEGGAGETLPVGSEIEFTGQVADIPEGWEYSEDDYNVYSTDEKRIGTWTDGKPLYRKVVTGTLPSLQVSSETVDGNVAHGISNIDIVTNIYGELVYSNVPYKFPILSSNGKATVIKTVNSENIVLRASDSWQAGPPVMFVLEYTKTTD